MSEKPNRLNSFIQQDQLEREKTLDEGTSLTTSSMVWHPYHMTHTSTYNYINFPTQGSGHFVLQRGNCLAEVKKILRFFQGIICTIMYILMYMELPPSRNRWATGPKQGVVQNHLPINICSCGQIIILPQLYQVCPHFQTTLL